MKHILFVSMVMALSACGIKSSDKVDVPFSWKPEEVRIQCPSGDCPDATGVLIFGIKNPGGYGLSRCTATLVESDMIITNAHCDQGVPSLTYAWFIKPDGSIGKVKQRLYKHLGGTSGIDRDLAFFRLDKPMPGTPKNISRTIPARMDKLVGWVIDQTYWDKNFTSLSLNKRECRVDRHMPLVGGGYDDKTLGVAVFDCEIKHGNSGSAMYVPGDTQNIQVLLNTLWQWSEASTPVAKKFKNLFFEVPAFMKRDYGMAERLHCAEVPFNAPPAEYCTRVNLESSVGDKIRAGAALRADEWLASVPSGYGGVEWTVQAVDGVYPDSYFGDLWGVVLLPVPYCLTGASQDVNMRAPFLRVGLNNTGEGEARVVGERNLLLRMRPMQAGSFALDSAWTWVGNNPGFRPSEKSRVAYEGLLASARRQNIAPCGPAARAQARQKALESVNDALRLNLPQFSMVPR